MARNMMPIPSGGGAKKLLVLVAVVVIVALIIQSPIHAAEATRAVFTSLGTFVHSLGL